MVRWRRFSGMIEEKISDLASYLQPDRAMSVQRLRNTRALRPSVQLLRRKSRHRGLGGGYDNRGAESSLSLCVMVSATIRALA